MDLNVYNKLQEITDHDASHTVKIQQVKETTYQVTLTWQS